MDILVFKTNLGDRKQIKKLFPLFKKIEGILRWNVDLEDQDRILRIVAEKISPSTVEFALKNAGYYCKELID